MKKPTVFKNIIKLFDSMESLGIQEIFLSHITDKELYDKIDEWFMSRSKSVARNKYVWWESTYSKKSFVKEPNIQSNPFLRITFVDFKF